MLCPGSWSRPSTGLYPWVSRSSAATRSRVGQVALARCRHSSRYSGASSRPCKVILLAGANRSRRHDRSPKSSGRSPSTPSAPAERQQRSRRWHAIPRPRRAILRPALGRSAAMGEHAYYSTHAGFLAHSLCDQGRFGDAAALVDALSGRRAPPTTSCRRSSGEAHRQESQRARVTIQPRSGSPRMRWRYWAGID